MAPSTSPLFRLLTPLLQTFRNVSSRPSLPTTLSPLSQSKPFSTSPQLLARPSKKQPGKDPRITLIRYHLQHPKTPRPLRLSRMRALRHWTIHRAWMLSRRKRLEKEEAELYRMYQSMHAACEELRTMDPPGSKDAGRLYRIAMEKKGIYGHGGVPIEYARLQTETPGKEPWNHGWTR
ncbi:hypothetical protein M430DRAFT_49982 [Amorphotheca resinae ATCC 22711]|uniref:Large ribosomal subunit protein mL40 n=1 Tax=Amorphotheca resinae ATCC 22711 TaxID=857342 RepID=A0A2T3B3S8_AMORE|nr:hypothetical protein M430DRAFT_49982 [Amorphotheca resinae ATCC 22711]PSS20290.1 hypothetical protein M430DRAFT_49982 [Amorphotheca resinae ATCC 22711]